MKYAADGQSIEIVVFDSNENPVSGQAANITCSLALDGDEGNRAPLTNNTYVELASKRYKTTLTLAETTAHQLSFDPVCPGYQAYVLPSNIIYTTLEDAIKTKTDTIISISVLSGGGGPVNLTTGEIVSPLVIGDDYLLEHGQAFQWTIPDPGYTVTECVFGMKHPTKGSFEVAGIPTVDGSNVVLTFELRSSDTFQLEAGPGYQASVHIMDGIYKSTRIRNQNNIEWVESQTVIDSTQGPGATEYSVLVNDGAGNPIPLCKCWVTSDEAGEVEVSDDLYTNILGEVTFKLDSGTYYLFMEKTGYTFSNPTEITVA
jgi:hypothetical protein